MNSFISFLMAIFCLDPSDPNSMVALATWVGAIIAGVTLIVLVSAGIRQLRQLRKESHRQLIMNLMQNWENDSMITARRTLQNLVKIEGREERLVAKLYELDKENDMQIFDLTKIANYFETIGVMLKTKQDKKIVNELIGDTIVSYYLLLEKWINENRKEFPDFCTKFESIYEYCKRDTK